MTAPNTRRARLAARLRAVRAAAFPSGNAFALHIGWSQSRVSKIETGAQLPSEDDIRTWVRGAGADLETATELLDLLAAVRVEYQSWRDTFRRSSPTGKQDSIAALEAQATRIGKYQPAMMLGLVQTAAYARELLTLPCGPMDSGATEAEVDAMVAGRVRRQDVLYDPGKQVQLVMGETALHSSPGSTGTLLGQLDRLVSVAALPSVELNVVPIDAPLPVMPLAGFALYDSEFVVMESLTGEQRTDDPEQVAVYVKAFGALRDAAMTGPDAVALIQRIASGLRCDGGST